MIIDMIIPIVDMISDIIIPIAAILKIFFYYIFCNITKYDFAKFHVKSTHPGAWSDKKYHGADRVKSVLNKVIGPKACNCNKKRL